MTCRIWQEERHKKEERDIQRKEPILIDCNVFCMKTMNPTTMVLNQGQTNGHLVKGLKLAKMILPTLSMVMTYQKI